jgi:hypothetical protein
MSRTELLVEAPPSAVYAVLMDPWAYGDWVVGSRRIRAVDPEWPAVGARFHHTVGIPVLHLDDSSRLLENIPDRRVRLEVRVRPFGIGVVCLELHAANRDATRVVMTEEPHRGLLDIAWSKPLDWITNLRNKRALQRLARLSEQRADTPASAP